MGRVVLALLMIVSLSSCVKNNIQPEYPIECSDDFQVEYNDVTLKAKAVYNDNLLIVDVESPDMIFSINRTATKVSSVDLQLSYTNNELQEFCPFICLYEALSQLNEICPQFDFTGGLYLTELECSGKKYEFYLNEDRTISKIKYENMIFDFGL